MSVGTVMLIVAAGLSSVGYLLCVILIRVVCLPRKPAENKNTATVVKETSRV